jgi:3-hydroxy-9,10-secoandrosta-1,3,5(10)-triene-9,17-dione monooxygenase
MAVGRLSGRWQFGSGAEHGPWMLLGAMVVDTDDKPTGAIHAVAPAADITIDDTWFTLGMRGTGSKGLVADDIFGPEYRAMPTRELFRGDFDSGVEVGPLYRLPVMGALSTMVAGGVLGMTQRGLGQFVEATVGRRDAYSGNSKMEKPSVQMRIAEALGEVECAALLVEKNCILLDHAMAENKPPLETVRAAQIRWNAAYAVELCLRATNRIYAIAGAGATRDGDPLQRWYRDINTASHHAICDFDGALLMKGRLALGLSAGTGV